MSNILQTNTIVDNRYRVIKLIKQGGFGAVYEAEDTRFNQKTVALKQMFLDPNLSPDYRERFEQAFHQEANILSDLRHQSLPIVSDHFTDTNGQFLVMNYIRGKDLAESLAYRMNSIQRPFTEQEILPWMIQVLNALEYLHGQTPPVIHRDIKPDNIKVTQKGEVYLLDFGTSKGVSGTRSTPAYTLDYAPPEQIQGMGTDPRSDLFSLAATMYHLLTGKSMGDEPRCDAETRSLAFIKYKSDPLTPPPGVSPQVSAVIMQALNLDSARRPESAKAMMDVLERNLDKNTKPPVLPSSPPTSILTQPAPISTAPKPQASIPTQTADESQASIPLKSALQTAYGQVFFARFIPIVLILLLGTVVWSIGSMGKKNTSVEQSPLTSPTTLLSTKIPRNTPTSMPITTPLYPTTLDEWRNATSKLSYDFTREGDHYWRFVPGNTYIIGGWIDDSESDNDAQAEVTLSDYWITKYPITNQQYSLFIDAGGYDKETYWTPNGWAWKKGYNGGKGRTQPYFWDDTNYNGEDQPVVGVTWYEMTAYAKWINEELVGTLPDGYRVQLPTEAAWEVACAYAVNGQRYRYPWGEEAPTRDLADFDDGSSSDSAATIGERPKGAAASGAQDMVGTVWEAMSSSYTGYAEGSAISVADFSRGDMDIPYQGGAWYSSDVINITRCAARRRDDPYIDLELNLNIIGFRLVLLP